MLHLDFSDDGRLSERRYIDSTTNTVLRRLIFDADGTVRLLDGDAKELASMKLHRALSSAPQLAPDLNGRVVLPMPIRTPEVILAALEKPDASVEVADENLPEDEAIALMLAYSANGNGARVVEIARQRFIDKGDTRDGLYVLLSRFPQALIQAAIPADATSGSAAKPGFDLRPPVEGSPVKQFVRQHVNWVRDQDDSIDFNVDAPTGSHLEQLATARNLFLRWKTDRATKDLTTAQVQQEVERTLAFIAKCRTPEIGWTLMSTMRPRLTAPELLAVFSKAAEPFEHQPQIGLLVRRDRITALFAAGQHEEGRKLFDEWLTVQVEQGFVPPIDAEIYKSFVGTDGQPAMDELLLTISWRLVDARMLQTAQLLAIQIRQLGNTKVADQILTTILSVLDAKQRPDVALQAIEQLRQLKDPRADRLLNQVMELPMADQIPSLWRFASALAADSGRTRLATERLERAMQIEFATRPKVINIETVRSDYSGLLAKFEELITASATLEVALPVDLAANIIQAADQWRTLDEDDTASCQTASRLLAKLNMKDVAWDYLTTPLAENSGESAPWIALARTLATDNETDLAHTAWTRAFEFETTNPEILLEHAQLLQTAGRLAPAKALLQQITTNQWQPRFAGCVQQAGVLAGSF